jgi:predicted nucleic acid-binding protein
MKVFLDTNVWLSATVFSGLCEELLLQCAERGWLHSSPLIRQEAHEVLLRKFPQSPNVCDLFDAIWQEAQLIDDVPEPANDADARLVAAATAAGVQLFITGDKRVLGWQGRHGASGAMRIVSPRQAWEVLFGAAAGH